MMDAGTLMGMSPREVLKLTLPELWFAMRGWQRSNGIDPDAKPAKAMSHARLMELVEKDKSLVEL